MLSSFARVLIRALLAAGLILNAAASHALTISYVAADLPDTIPGQDLWEITYSLDAFPFSAGYGFSVLFDPALYSGLEDPPPIVNDDWDVIVLQPDLLLPDPGRYDALSLAATPSIADPFRVSFVFLGIGMPGSQPFEVYNPSFNTVQSGFTVVPEPGTGALVLVGLLLARGQRPRAPGRK